MNIEEQCGFMVCVNCWTYNQHVYITDTMNGFAIQKTEFPFVCTIVDDASNDGEQAVIKAYLNENFDIQDALTAYEKDTDYGHIDFARHKANKNCYFAVIYLNENHGSRKRPKTPYVKEWVDQVKYMACCEGDDYWTDPYKLQKQIDYMEGHADCCMTASAANWEIDGVLYEKGCQYEDECDLSTDEIIRKGGYYLATASLLFRSELYNDRPTWRKMANVGDFPLQILGTLRGHLHFFPDKMCVYRYMVSGSFSEKHKVWPSDYLFAKIRWMEMLDKDTKHLYSKAIYYNLYNYCYRQLYKAKETSLLKCLCVIFKSDHKVYNIKHLFRDFVDRFNEKQIH